MSVSIGYCLTCASQTPVGFQPALIMVTSQPNAVFSRLVVSVVRPVPLNLSNGIDIFVEITKSLGGGTPGWVPGEKHYKIPPSADGLSTKDRPFIVSIVFDTSEADAEKRKRKRTNSRALVTVIKFH